MAVKQRERERPQQLEDCQRLLSEYQQKVVTVSEPPVTPTLSYAELLQIDWIDSVWAMHNRLRESGETDAEGLAIATQYLQLQHRLNTNPRPLVEGNGTGKGHAHKLDVTELEACLEALLHPYQVPLTLDHIQQELKDRYRFVICYQLLLRHCVRLCEVGSQQMGLQRFANPYKRRQHVYCNADFQLKPQIGDKVVELVHMRSRRYGVVTEFQLYRPLGRYFPVIQTPTHKCFVDPGRIMIVERLDEFEAPKRRQATRRTSRQRLSIYSI